MSLSHLEGRR